MKYRVPEDEEAAIVAGLEAATENLEESKTMAAFAKDADLNEIVRRMMAGHMEFQPMEPDARFFGDVSDMPDLATAMQRIRAAEEAFSRLPAKVRERFGHAPAQFWTWLQDEANVDEAEKLGILRKRSPEPPKAPEGAAPAA